MKSLSLALLLAGGAEATTLQMATGANPLRKVITLLQDMQKEVAAEGEKEEELFKKFMCYCKQNSGAQEQALAEAESDMNTNSALAEETAGLKKQVEEELAGHKQDRTDDKGALDKANGERADELAKYEQAHAQTSQDLDGCGKAIAALEKGSSKLFLQTGFANNLKSMIQRKRNSATMDINDADAVLGFLQGDYHSVTGEIVGILKNMKEEFAKSLGEMEEAEAASIKTFQELKAAKEASIQAATEAIEQKTEKKGELAVKATEAKASAEAAAKEMEDAQNFAANLKKTCDAKQKAMDARQKERASEIEAIGQAIEVLNDDDALDVFKGAVKQNDEGKKSFLQMRVTKASPKTKATAMIQSLARSKQTNKAVAIVMRTALTQLKQAKPDFGKIIAMIDDMVKLLGQEAKDDEKTRDWCNAELNENAAKGKELNTHIKTLNTRVEEATAGIEEAAEVMAHKTEEIKALDTSVAEAGETRKKENATWKEESSLSATAVKLLNKAKNKLNKFYNPSMYKAPEERELTEEERLLQGAGQDIGETEVEAFSFLQTDEQAAPPAAPETFGDSYQKSGKSNSVLALLDNIINDLEKEAQAAKMNEEQAQKDYEELMADSAKSRAEFVEIINQKTAASAEMSEQKNSDTEAEAAAQTQLKENTKQEFSLHDDCDFLLENFDSRREQRTNEIEGLKTAKAALSGADYSM